MNANGGAGSGALPSPAELRARHPVGIHARRIAAARAAIHDALRDRDPRLVIVVGPCSIHDADAALEYAARLRPVIDETRGELIVVMRTYVQKPRTTVGWKGFVNDPRLDGSCDLGGGLEEARALLLRILALGVPCASELLDPVVTPYLEDLLSWVAIGARTSESQLHREIASGLAAPVGFKNTTGGSIEGAAQAVLAARRSHTFAGVDEQGRCAVLRSRGNRDAHVVLRGGRTRPNYGPRYVAAAAEPLARLGIPRGVLLDCSHDNSGKDPRRQGRVCRAILRRVRGGESGILGLLLESNLEGGRQDWFPGAPLRRGVSITDACLGLPETVRLLREAARAVRTPVAGRGGAPVPWRGRQAGRA